MFTIGGAWTVLVPVLLGFAWHGPRCLRGVGGCYLWDPQCGCYLWVLPTSPNRMVKPRYNFLLVQDAELAIRRGCLGLDCIKENWETLTMTLRVSDLDCIHNSCLGSKYGSQYWEPLSRMMMIIESCIIQVPLNRWWGYVGSKYGNAAEISLKATWH